ncbi:hypothetical protein MNV49_004627 [Pseudohyphozyma bogoriensis]|nr:hypothetical protein MNV49_004627 [Pseudohyphozyma bogoriensis]
MGGNFFVAYVLREVMFPVINNMEGTWEISQVLNLESTLLGWIKAIKVAFYTDLGYAALGLIGFIGGLFAIAWMLWIYLVYLLVSLVVSTYYIVTELIAALKIVDSVEKACGILNVSACSSIGDEIRK